jgi:hypothetical protein
VFYLEPPRCAALQAADLGGVPAGTDALLLRIVFYKLVVCYLHLLHHCAALPCRPLIWVECLVERPSRSRTDYVVKARSQFKERSVATNVEIILPLPSDATTPVTRCSQVRAACLGPWLCCRHTPTCAASDRSC